MPEYVVRTRPGATTVRVVRPDGVTRVRTRLAAPWGGGGGGVTVHNLLTGRDAEDAHPIGAITGLQDALDNGGASALADLTDVDVVSDPPAQDDVLAWDDTGGKWTPATLSGGADLSDTTPQALGTAAAGDGTAAARDDHVHAMPTAADVGADPAGTAAGLVDDLSGVSNQSAARSNLGLGTAATADTGTGSSNVILGNDSRLTDARTPTAHTHTASDVTTGLAAVATSGDYGDLSGKPTIPDSADDIGAAPAANALGYVNHGSTASTARPSGYAAIVWVGTVEPTNAVNGDIWENPS